MKVSVILPSYNERGSLEALIPALSDILDKEGYRDREIIVVDDNSPDGTAEAVRKLAQRDPGVRLIVRLKERGLASAVQHGIQEAHGGVLVVMDSDFNHHPDDVPRLLREIDRYDIVVGSRYVPGGAMETSKPRYYLSFFFNLFIRLLLGLNSTDNLSGFFAVRKSVMDQFDVNGIFEGFGEFHIPFVYWATKVKRFSLYELPTVYRRRIYGKSKFRYFSNLMNYTWVVIRLKLGMFSWQRKVRVKI